MTDHVALARHLASCMSLAKHLANCLALVARWQRGQAYDDTDERVAEVISDSQIALEEFEACR